MYICELSLAYRYPVHSGAHEGQKKAPDPLEPGITNGCEVTYEGWEARPYLLSHNSTSVTWYFLQGGFD